MWKVKKCIYKFYFTFIKCYQSINDVISFLWCIKKFLKICQQTDQIRMVQWEHANRKIHSFILENFIPPLAIPWIIFSLCIGVRGVELLLRAVRGTSHNYNFLFFPNFNNFLFPFHQCWGSGSKLDPYLGPLWIRICIPNTDPDIE